MGEGEARPLPWVTSSNFPAPRLLDAVGSPNTASIGGLLLVAGACINIFAPTIEVLYVGRALQGAGIALLVNAAILVTRSSTPASRGEASTLARRRYP